MKLTSEQLFSVGDMLLEILNDLEPADAGTLLSYLAGRTFGSKRFDPEPGLDRCIEMHSDQIRRYAAVQKAIEEEDVNDPKVNSVN